MQKMKTMLDQALYRFGSSNDWTNPSSISFKSAHNEYQDRTLKIDCTRRKVPSSESEYNKFKPRLKFAKNRFQLSAGLNLEAYLSHVSNLCRSSNS